MSLIVDGQAAMRAMLDAPDRFVRIKDRDWANAAIKLARKQLVAGRQDHGDLVALREALGADIFEKTLDTLTAHQAKQLAARIDPDHRQGDFATGASALDHIRIRLAEPVAASKTQPDRDAANGAGPRDAPRKPNPYLGRKAFRTGR